MEKPTVAVIFGGESSEYEVSLSSAYSVLSEIDYEKYNIIKIGITKNGKWYLYWGESSLILNDKWHESQSKKELTIDINEGRLLANGAPLLIDKILPVLHGEYGEDGRLGALFEILKMDYSGCQFFSSAISMDKDTTKLIAEREGINVARWLVVFESDLKNEAKIQKEARKIGYPVFVKPSRGGSSVGVYQAKTEKELIPLIKEAFKVCPKVLIEEKINGTETEIAVLYKNGKAVFSTPGQIKYKSEFYDYDAKYNSSEIDYIIPARITKESEKRLRQYAKRLCRALEIKNLSRMDFFVTDSGKVVFNEVNTFPGFTGISMFPKLLMHDGYTFKNIINYILNI
ncbi:MAG: D-alanine--D-alanine ligase [Clostridia bacterium]|nr:D-alanine--D-alanine ligase [Clostridia bacterium]